jgi:hypothetical protein
MGIKHLKKHLLVCVYLKQKLCEFGSSGIILGETHFCFYYGINRNDINCIIFSVLISELQVEFTNLCSCPIKWSVSSISPAYVKVCYWFGSCFQACFLCGRVKVFKLKIIYVIFVLFSLMIDCSSRWKWLDLVQLVVVLHTLTKFRCFKSN